MGASISIYLAIENKSQFKETLQNTARSIKQSLKVKDWETASEDQLKKRDKIHENISLLCDVIPVEKAIDLGIKKELTA